MTPKEMIYGHVGIGEEFSIPQLAEIIGYNGSYEYNVIQSKLNRSLRRMIKWGEVTKLGPRKRADGRTVTMWRLER